MAGHRKQHGRPPRHQARAQRNRARLAAAGTAEEQLAAAYDWLRMSARHIPGAAERARVLRTHAQALAGAAAEIDGRVHGHAQ
jgi:hypothetical protein